jgi:hypothetical protein
VRKGLVPLLAELREKGSPPDDSWLHGSYSLDTQAALCKEVALALGFDTNNGRLDVSVHPFTGGVNLCCSMCVFVVCLVRQMCTAVCGVYCRHLCSCRTPSGT